MNGLIAVVKRDCPTCALVAPLFGDLVRFAGPLTVYCQDVPGFPESFPTVRDDSKLEESYRLGVVIVPTLLRMEDGKEVARVISWNRDEWREITEIPDLGADLSENRPGCGSMTEEPRMMYRLRAKFGNTNLASRRISLPAEADLVETCFERGWTDGLPVVPPTESRVLEILDGTRRPPDEIVGLMPPNRVDCTIENIAINAVMAGGLPAGIHAGGDRRGRQSHHRG